MESFIKPNQQDDIIRQICLHIAIFEPDEDKYTPIGTGVLIAPYLLLTAKHILDGLNENKHAIMCLQAIENGQAHILRKATGGVGLLSGDLCVLNLEMYGHTSDNKINLSIPKLTFDIIPPVVGDKVVAFGYGLGDISSKDRNVKRNTGGDTAGGIVIDVYLNGRDRSLAPHSGIACKFRNKHGMSGGIVINDKGGIIGLICTGYDEEEYSYVSLVWPILGLHIDYSLKNEECKRFIDLNEKFIRIRGLEKIKIEDDKVIILLS